MPRMAALRPDSVETLPISFDKEKEPEFRKGSLAYRNYFKLRPGKYRLKLAVSDESNNLGSTEQSLEVPAFPDQGFAGSSIVIAEQTSQLPDLIRNLQTQLLDENDPLLYPGVQIEPSVENRLPAGSVILRSCSGYTTCPAHRSMGPGSQSKTSGRNRKGICSGPDLFEKGYVCCGRRGSCRRAPSIVPGCTARQIPVDH